MQSSLSSNYDSPESSKSVSDPEKHELNKAPQFERSKFSNLKQIITWLCRIIFGSTFLYSGFVKAVDPWGTFYKFTEYLNALGIDLVPNIILSGVFGLCAIEFIIGLCILIGCYRKSAPIAGGLIMAVMLPLTLWIAIKDPVADCGCFGDALIISNWATFWKNIFLSALVIWLIKHNKHAYALITPALQWIAIVISIAFISVILFYGYFRQPLIDFRPYPVSETLISEDEEDDTKFVFVYSRNGILKELNEEDELPSEEDGWEFVERKEINNPSENSSSNSHKTFRIWDETGDHDMTETAITGEGKQLILLIPDLATVSPATTWKINLLNDKAAENDIDMIAAVAGNSELINEWTDLSMPQYDIYIAEDTAIKEVARGNPAIVYLENGIIEWKTSLNSLDAEEFGSEDGMKKLTEELNNNMTILKASSFLYISLLAFLIALSFLPRLRRMFQNSPKKSIFRIGNVDGHKEES